MTTASDSVRPADEDARRRRPWSRRAAAAGLAAALLAPAPGAAATTAQDSVQEVEPGQQEEPSQQAPEQEVPPQGEDSAEQNAQEDGQATSEEGLVDFSIVASNDFHGRVEESASVLACTVDGYREQNPNTIFASAGDNIGASTFTSFIQQDEPSIEALNAMDLDVSVLGNHEFDQGAADMDDRVIPMSDFPWIGANIRDAETGEHLYDPYYIQEVDGVRVAFIGLITEDMPNLVSPDGIEGIEWTSMSEESNHYAEHLTENDMADVVTVLVHEGLPGTSPDSASGLPFDDLVENAHPEIAAIMSGHTHQPHVHDLDGMLVTQAGEYGDYVNVLDFSFDPSTGELVESEAELVDLFPEGEPRCDGHPEVDQIVSDAVATADELGSEVIAETAGDVPFSRAVNSDGTENRSAASPLGQLIADAQLWAIRQNQPDVDFAVTNAGGLRADLPLGELTYRDLGDVQPFANTLVNVELTGEQVYRLFEEQWREDGSFSKHAQSSEVRYTYDAEAPEGERVQEVTIDGELVDPEATYTVGMNSYMAAGGGVEVPTEAVSTQDTGMNDLEAFVDYAREQEVLEPSLDRRAVGITWVSEHPAETVYAPGDEIALDLSGLSYSSEDVPVGESVEVSLAGFDLGELDIDTDYADASDERGTTEIRAEVPSALEFSGQVTPGLGAMSGSSGGEEEIEVPLVILEETTGTELTIPVTVLSSPTAGDGTDDAGADASAGTDGEGQPEGAAAGTGEAEQDDEAAGGGPDEAAGAGDDAPGTDGSAGAEQDETAGAADQDDAAAAQDGNLAVTGAQVAWTALIAAVLLGVGTLLVTRSRQRQAG